MHEEKGSTLKTAARYLGLKAGQQAPDMAALLEAAYGKMRAAAAPKHTLKRFPVTVAKDESLVTLGSLPPVKSRDLSKLFSGCQEGISLLATLGMELDLLLRRLAVTDAALGLAVGACGSAYIDVYIDGVLQTEATRLAQSGEYLTPRFSPGYGDAPLMMQPGLISFLDGSRLGVCLTEGLMMLPEKSVSAVMGITKEPRNGCSSHCSICAKTDCAFREEKA